MVPSRNSVPADLRQVEERLETLIAALPHLRDHHARSAPAYPHLKRLARLEVEAAFAQTDDDAAALGPFGELRFPYHQMGNIDSIDLFALDELIIFAFYWVNRLRYRRVADFGANIGLHTFVLARCGFEVRSFEPDPNHFRILERTIERNALASVVTYPVAVSISDGMHEFVRVVDNTTGSHLAGAKSAPYGPLQRFMVETVAAGPHVAWADLVKMDIEGHEAALIAELPAETWAATDAIIEVGNAQNAAQIFNHFVRSEINLFSQKTNWARVSRLEDMPTNHRDGSLFITAKLEMPWS